MSRILTRMNSAMEVIDRMLAELETAHETVTAAIVRIERRLQYPRYRRRKGGAL